MTVSELLKQGIAACKAGRKAEARALLEQVAAPYQLSSHEKIVTPTVPSAHAEAWRNLNEPADLEFLVEGRIIIPVY